MVSNKCSDISTRSTCHGNSLVPYVKPKPSLAATTEPPGVAVAHLRNIVALTWHCRDLFGGVQKFSILFASSWYDPKKHEYVGCFIFPPNCKCLVNSAAGAAIHVTRIVHNWKTGVRSMCGVPAPVRGGQPLGGYASLHLGVRGGCASRPLDQVVQLLRSPRRLPAG